MKIHMVKQGDTLYLIAKKYNVALEEMIKANPEISNPDEIAVGMKVKIPSQPKSAVEVIHQHIVQQGDSLWKLSKAWGIQLADMIKVNPQLKNPNALLTGEVVNIPKPPHGASQMATMNSSLIPGKANTGLKPGTGMKPLTAVKPDTSIQPILPIQTQPLVTPPPVTIAPILPPKQQLAPLMPIAENKPIYGFEMQENMNLFMQYPVPAVQATAPAEQPYCPDPLPYGYGMQQPMVSPLAVENAHGYGYGYGHENNQGYGHENNQGYGHENNHGYDQSPLGDKIAGTIGGMYDPNDYIGYGDYNQLPYNQPLHNQPLSQSLSNQPFYNQPLSNQPPYNPSFVQGLTSPAAMGIKKPAGCKCGGASAWPAHLDANAGAIPYTNNYPGVGNPAENVPYAASPFGASPAENVPYAVSPFGASPMGNAPYEAYPQASSPFENYPGMHYGGYPTPQVAGASLGGMPSPSIGYKPHAEPYYGGIPPIPTMPAIPPMPPMPPMGPLVDHYDDRSSSSDGNVTVTASAVKKRSSKPRAKQKVTKQFKQERKENLPWIKW